MRSAANFEDKGYLRVLTPQTSDGVTLKYNKLDKVVMKETRLPLTAKKHMELENESRAGHLKHKLEIVEPEMKAPPKKGQVKEPVIPPVKDENDEEGEEEGEPGKRKPGRPKKEESEQV